MSGRKERWFVAITISVQVTLVLSMIVCGFESLIPDDTTAARIHAWIGLLSGTFPDLDRYSIERMTYGFALALTFKFYFFLLPFLGIFGLLYRLITTERRQLMRWIDLLATRDGAIKAAILRDLIKRDDSNAESLKQISDTLDQLFQEAGQVWEDEYLPRMFNPETVDSLRRELHDRQVPGHAAMF